jgi:peptidoglycan hydrolase-like protein with peptidoglycan-binding domain
MTGWLLHEEESGMLLRQIIPSVTLATSLFVAAGCTTMESQGTQVSTAQQQLEQKDEELATLMASKAELEKTLAQRDREFQQQAQQAREAQQIALAAREQAQAAEARAAATQPTADGEVMLPPNAQPGECYARVFVPPTYNTMTEQVLKREASERLETIPAQYTWVEETVTVQEPSQKIEVIPATYEWVEEQMLVKPTATEVEVVPPMYETMTEQVLVKPAQVVWKKGTGPMQRIDYATGEIMCLVEEPAVYKTISKRVVKTPATTRTVEIPAEYTTVKKRVIKTPATTRTVEIPGQYKTMKVRKLVTPEQVKRMPVPAEYETVTKRVQASDGHMAWQTVLCETNATPGMVMEIQRALFGAGYDPGPLDGQIGPQTLEAVTAFQRSKGLASGGITLETLRALGVKIGV